MASKKTLTTAVEVDTDTGQVWEKFLSASSGGTDRGFVESKTEERSAE